MNTDDTEKTEDEEFINPFKSNTFDGEHCFLCGIYLNKPTKEHIFPKWLMHKFNLWDETLTLKNDKPIQYSKLTIPCCLECNRENLSKLENEIKFAVEGGYSSIKSVDEVKIFLWLAKIFYALRFKEAFLKQDISTPDSSKIVSKKSLDAMYALNTMLKGVKYGIRFITPDIPFSILVINLHTQPTDKFFFIDDDSSHTIYLRLDNIAIIGCLQDFGIISQTYGKNYLDIVSGRKLSLIQADELFVKAAFQSIRIKNTPFYMFHTVKTLGVPITCHVQNYPQLPEDYDYYLYFNYLSYYFEKLHPDVELEFLPPSTMSSFLADENGNIKLHDASGKVLDV